MTVDPRHGHLLDRAALTDRTRCPSCGARLSTARCPVCGIDLSGTDGHLLWALSMQAEQALVARDRVVGKLRRATGASAAPAPSASPGTPVPAAPQRQYPAPVPVALPGQAPGPAPAPRGQSPVAPRGQAPVPVAPLPPDFGWAPAGRRAPDRPGTRIGVQVLLVGLGAFLLSVAALVFLIRSWDRIALGGRASIIAVATVLTLALAVRVARTLRATGEALGALGAVLVLADIWAVRHTGLFGADRPDGALFGAIAVAMATVLLGVWGAVGRLRAGTLGAALLLPLPSLFTGLFLAGSVNGVAIFGVLAGAALLASAVAVVRVRVPENRRAERGVLQLWAGSGWSGGLVLGLPVLISGSRAGSATLLLAAGAVALGQLRAEPGDGPQPAGSAGSAGSTRSGGSARSARTAWSAAAGWSVALIPLPVALGLVEAAGGNPLWVGAAAPAGTGLVLLALTRAMPVLRVAGVRAGALLLAGAVVQGVLALPGAGIAMGWLLGAAGSAVSVWRWTPGSGLDEVLGVPALDPAILVAGHGAAVGGLAALALTAVLLARFSLTPIAPERRRDLRRAATWFAVPSLTVACLAPGLTLAAGIGALIALGTFGGVLIGHPRTGRLGTAAGATLALTAGVLAVLLSGNSRDLTVPVWLLGVLALVVARRPAPVTARPLLVAAANTLLLGTAAAAVALSGATGADRFLGAGLLSAAMLAVFTGVRAFPGRSGRFLGPALSVPERGVGAAVAATGLALAPVGTVGAAGGGTAARLAVLAAAAAGAAAAAAVRRDGPLGRGVPAVAAALLTPLVAGAAVATRVAVASGPAPSTVLTGVACAAAVLIAGVLLLPRGAGLLRDPRRIPAETGVVAVAVLAGLAAGGPDRLWVVLFLSGAGVAALAVLPDRHFLAGAASALFIMSSWIRLGIDDIGPLEAYSLPPAVALLLVGGLRWRRDRAAGPWQTFGPGVAAALLPSLSASVGGGDLRPLLLLGVGAAGVGSAVAAQASRDLQVPAVVGVVTALGVGLGRPLGALIRGEVGIAALERWSLPAAVLLLAAGPVLRLPLRGHPGAGPGQGPVPGAGRGTAPVPGRAALPRAGLPRTWWAVPGVLLAVAVPVLGAVTEVARAASGEVGAGPARRSAAVLAGGSVLVVATALRRRDGVRGRPLVAVGLAAAGTADVVGWAARGYAVPAGSSPVDTVLGWWLHQDGPEVWTVPPALLLLAVGVGAMRRDRGIRSWPALGPGLAVLLLPSLPVAAARGGTVRIVALVVVSAAVVAVGVVLRWQAPALAGAVVLSGHAAVQLGPWLVDLAGTAPRWVTLGVVGGFLLILGTSYERRLQQVRDGRSWLVSLR